jgi:hypothetical protein
MEVQFIYLAYMRVYISIITNVVYVEKYIPDNFLFPYTRGCPVITFDSHLNTTVFTVAVLTSISLLSYFKRIVLGDDNN